MKIVSEHLDYDPVLFCLKWDFYSLRIKTPSFLNYGKTVNKIINIWNTYICIYIYIYIPYIIYDLPYIIYHKEGS